MELSFNGEEVTPNLNKLANEGIMFTNFYSQVGVGTSSDAEFTFSTSLMPSSSGTVFVNYFNREYVTIQKLFKEQGYYTFSTHANTGDFWNRSTMHKNMGYDDFYSEIANFNSLIENHQLESNIMSLDSSVNCAKILSAIKERL